MLMSRRSIANELQNEPGVDKGAGWDNPGLRAGGMVFAMQVDGRLVVKPAHAALHSSSGRRRAHHDRQACAPARPRSGQMNSRKHCS